MTTTVARTPGPPLRALALITTGLFSLLMFVSGLALLTSRPQAVRALVALGYPAYLPPLLGFAKIAGALALTVPKIPPRVREWAYAGFAFDLIGAVFSHARGGGSPAPAALAAVLLASSYGLRRLQEA